MIARDRARVIGRTIVDVEVSRFWNPRYRRNEVAVDALVLDDGSRITFSATSDGDQDYAVLHLNRPTRKDPST